LPEADVVNQDDPLIVLPGCLHLKRDPSKERLLGQFKGRIAQLMAHVTRDKTVHATPAQNHSTWRPPINLAVLDFLQDQATKRKVFLVTDRSRDEILNLLGANNIFHEIVSAGDSPADAIKPLIGNSSFALMGTADTTPELWSQASTRHLVKVEHLSDSATQNEVELEQIFDAPKPSLASLKSSLRTYQWTKNFLVFVPLVAAHELSDINAIVAALGMFVCFCLVSSFGYVINDLLDLQSDRAHPIKYRRPFASGQLDVRQGLSLAGILFALAVLGGNLLPYPSLFVLLGYLLLTVSYSIYLKTRLMLDVVALGATFTLRVLGGAVAIQSELSFYLLSFSIFLFSSLSLLKRYAELHNLRERRKTFARGRGYAVEDMGTVRSIGVALGCMSAFILGQYINSPLVTQFYTKPQLIWMLFPLLLYWLGRIWILAGRGQVNEDPLIFAMRDNASRAVLVIGAIVVFLAV
jgi:4-hydroxybenzoate polyprenyltransferase